MSELGKSVLEKAKTFSQIEKQYSPFSERKWVPCEDYQVLSEKAQKLETEKHNAEIERDEVIQILRKTEKDNTNIHFLYKQAQAENEKLEKEVEIEHNFHLASDHKMEVVNKTIEELIWLRVYSDPKTDHDLLQEEAQIDKLEKQLIALFDLTFERFNGCKSLVELQKKESLQTSVGNKEKGEKQA
jgi:hypothetical protein